MRYIGSKSSSIEEIYDLVSQFQAGGTFCDPFGGTATVGSYFKQKGFQVFTGDLLQFAHYIQIAKLAYHIQPEFIKLKRYLGFACTEDLVNYLNDLPHATQWFVQNFAIDRGYFTRENAEKVEAVWLEIIRFKKVGAIDGNEFAYLMASLIEAMDRVANTAGTYYAYLKKISVKAARIFEFLLIKPMPGEFIGSSTLGDAYDLVTDRYYDVIYLDPPYNDRRYHGYYHLPEALARGIMPDVAGTAGVCKINMTLDTDFYKVSSALASLTKILEAAKFKVLLF